MYKKLFLITIIACCLQNFLSAELLILKKDTTTNQIVPLSEQDSITYGFEICQILLKYQWPMCLASDLTEEERSQLLGEHKAYAEELFIEEKLKERISGIDFVVLFFSTSLYELYGLVEYFKSCKKDSRVTEIYANPGMMGWGIMSHINTRGMMTLRSRAMFPTAQQLQNSPSGDDKNAFMKAAAAFNLEIKTRLHKFDETVTKMLNEKTFFDKTAVDIRKAVLKYYASINNPFYTADFLKKAEIPVMNFNRTISMFLSKQIPDLFDQQSKDVIVQKIFQHRYAIAEEMIKEFHENYTRSCLYDTHSHTSQLNDAIIFQVIDVEYQAQKTNNALLFRGSKPIAAPIGKGQVAHIAGQALQVPADKHNLVAATLESYKQNKFPYSVSLGNSLFAGYVNNQGGCAYAYMTMKRFEGHNIGIILLVNKKDQYEHDSFNLFFIPPLASMVSLFEYGVLFHPRVKAAVKSKNPTVQEIVGVKNKVFQDPAGIIMITRDPLKHTVLFSDYMAKHSVVLTDSQDKSDSLLKAQGQSTNFYKSLHTLKNFASSVHA